MVAPNRSLLNRECSLIKALGYAHVERWEVSALIACAGQRLFPALVSAYGGHVESWRPALVY
jgi:hypothetical protein